LILKSGKILAAGEKTSVLNAPNLSRAFNARIALQKQSRRYRLTVAPASRRVI
jgi:ABC-type cobalamin transport system ATPase subunit